MIVLFDYDLASQMAIRMRKRNGELGCDNLIWEQTVAAFTAPPASSSSSSSGTGNSSGSSSSSSGAPYCSNPPLCSGNYQYIANNAGMIELYDYDLASQMAVRMRKRNGELGCDNLIWEQTIAAFNAPRANSSSSSGTGNSSGSSRGSETGQV